MRKRIVCVATALLAVIVLTACLRQEKPEEMARIEPVSARDFMRASLVYDQGLRTLRGTQTLDARNRTGADLEEIVLRLYMNAGEDENASVSGVTVNRQSVSFFQDADEPTVLRIAYPWKSGEEIEISWTVMIKHAKTDGAAVITLPSLAMYEDGAWRTDAYDELAEPSYGEAFDYALDVIIKDSVKAAFGGQIASQRWETGIGETLYAVQMRMARDASFALLGGGSVKEKAVSGVHIRTLARDAGTAKTLLSKAQEALESLESAGIAYPYDSLTVAESDTGRVDGLALSGLIVLDAGEDKEQLRRKLARLIARETFGIFIESDPWNAPWLSHTLASAAEMLAYRELKGAAAYEERLYGEMEFSTRLTRPAGVCVGASTAHFGSDIEMTQVLRDQGAAMLLGIEQAVGEETFASSLSIYVQDCGGKIGSLFALCEAFEQATGSSWDGYLSDMLAF